MNNQPATNLLNDPPLLNPILDRAALAREFQQKGRIDIPDVLTSPSAQRIHACLKDETPNYNLVLNKGDEASEFRNLTQQQQQEQTKIAWRQVGTGGFQFLYEQHTLSVNGEPYFEPHHYWAKVTSFLNGPEFLGFAREVTQIKEIELADAQATLYRAGHFLTAHDDSKPGQNRLAAYVLSLTPAWRPEWGGLLEFIGKNGHVEDGYVPNFNSLRLFRVPMRHYVSFIPPYALAYRYSITGWLRAR